MNATDFAFIIGPLTIAAAAVWGWLLWNEWQDKRGPRP